MVEPARVHVVGLAERVLADRERPRAAHAGADALLPRRGAQAEDVVVVDENLAGVTPGLFERVLTPAIDRQPGAVDCPRSARRRVPARYPLAGRLLDELLVGLLALEGALGDVFGS